MSGRQLGARISPAIRALVDRAGPVNAATRALLILGAHAAGQDVQALHSTIHVLIDRGELSGPTIAALRRLAEGAAINRDSSSDSTPPDDGLLSDLLDDPLAGVGIEV